MKTLTFAFALIALSVTSFGLFAAPAGAEAKCRSRRVCATTSPKTVKALTAKAA